MVKENIIITCIGEDNTLRFSFNESSLIIYFNCTQYDEDGECNYQEEYSFTYNKGDKKAIGWRRYDTNDRYIDYMFPNAIRDLISESNISNEDKETLLTFVGKDTRVLSYRAIHPNHLGMIAIETSGNDIIVSGKEIIIPQMGNISKSEDTLKFTMPLIYDGVKKGNL